MQSLLLLNVTCYRVVRFLCSSGRGGGGGRGGDYGRGGGYRERDGYDRRSSPRRYGRCVQSMH